LRIAAGRGVDRVRVTAQTVVRRARGRPVARNGTVVRGDRLTDWVFDPADHEEPPMITLSGIGRFLASSAVGLVVLTAACSDVVAKDNVAKTIMDQLQKQSIDAQNVACPADLPATVGQTVRCSFTVDGQPVDAIATVTSVDGSNVKYDITTEARPIAKDLLSRKITDQVSQQARLPVDSATCDADLQPMVNAVTTCTLISRKKPMNVTVTVTKVSGGLIKYSIKRA
jgi:Domain of unknown function (DUF4333)